MPQCFMAEKRNGLRGQISADAHYGGFHFCGFCPYALLYHWGCVGAGNVRLVDPNDIEKVQEIYRRISIEAPPESSLPIV